MDIVGQDALWSFSKTGRMSKRQCFAVRVDAPLKVRNFLDLAERVAQLQFKNQNYVMLFRGQNSAYFRSNKDSVKFTSLTPSMFRKINDRNPTESQIREKFDRLENAEEQLITKYEIEKLPDVDRLKRQQILRWAILQHYGVCDTPLLDVSQSLRIAASFASDGADKNAFLYVLGVPQLSGSITASAEAGIQILRLSGVCPPSALRPHLQEGYLLGEYPEMISHRQKQHYEHFEIDFGRRLIAKFEFDPATFWQKSADFPQVPHTALYPDNDDPLFELTKNIE